MPSVVSNLIDRKFYGVSGDISPRYRKLIAFCKRREICLTTYPADQHGWGVARVRLEDGCIRPGISVWLRDIGADTDSGIAAFGHEIGHIVLGAPRYGRSIRTHFKGGRPLGFLVVLVEALAWLVGYVVILLTTRAYLPIGIYILEATKGVGSYILTFFVRSSSLVVLIMGTAMKILGKFPPSRPRIEVC